MISRTILDSFYLKHDSKKKITSSREIARSWKVAKMVILANFANAKVRQSVKKWRGLGLNVKVQKKTSFMAYFVFVDPRTIFNLFYAKHGSKKKLY